MDLQTIGLGLSIFVVAVAGVVWGVRQEGRINSHDTLFIEREKQQKARDEDIIQRLERIERKQDTSNGNGHRTSGA